MGKNALSLVASIALLIGGGVSAPAEAQTGFATLSGVVVDSLHNEPLAGAQVSLTGSTRHGITGTDGRFRIDSIESGAHDISVSHPFVDSVGLALRANGVVFARGQQARAAFAVPSERGMRTLFCGENGSAQNHTILTGRVRRVDSDAPAANATVELDWIEVGFQRGKGVINEPRRLSAQTNSEGRYVFCNLPDSLDATIRAVTAVESSGQITVSLGGKSIGIQDLSLPPATLGIVTKDSVPTRATIRGRVTDDKGRALSGATVDVIRGESSTTTNADGEFSLARSPMGSQLLRVRKLGFAESLQPVTIAANAARFDVELSKAVAALDPVVIRARLSDAAVRSGFERRALNGAGRYISGEYFQNHSSGCVFDRITIPGYTFMRGSFCSFGLVPRKRGYELMGSSFDKCVTLYVDNFEEHANTERTGLNAWQLSWLNPKSVVGVEMYSPESAPIRFPHPVKCALILIWTSSFQGRQL